MHTCASHNPVCRTINTLTLSYVTIHTTSSEQVGHVQLSGWAIHTAEAMPRISHISQAHSAVTPFSMKVTGRL